MNLIINGDDFGLSHGCNLAIIDSYTKGIMTSASLMVNMPDTEEAVRMWKKNSALSLGIHLNVTVGMPILEHLNTITQLNGAFNKRILIADQSEINEEELKKECEAQINRFIQLTGKIPDHINSHHGIEAVPGGEKVLQDLAVKYKVPIRELTHISKKEKIYYRTNYEIPHKCCLYPKIQNVDELILNFSKESIESNRTYELLGHPGYVDFGLLKKSSLTIGRCIDANLFNNEVIKLWVKQNHIQLISYKELPVKERK